MKYAYLIIAHHEFTVLQYLVRLLDDPRNDIYVHFDKKAKNIPDLSCMYSHVYTVNERIDVRWGHESQIQSEYALFETAINGAEQYDRYILISGTHLPLKTQDEIHAFFNDHYGKEVLSPIGTNDYEIDMKLFRHHFFVRWYKHPRPIVRKCSQFLWHVFLKAQYVLNIKRVRPPVSIKANNWVCLTPQAMAYIVEKKKEVLRQFKRTFCGDEFFVPYLLENAPDKFKVVSYPKLLYNDFVRESPRVLCDEDLESLIQSDYLFARKFSEGCIGVVQAIARRLGYLPIFIGMVLESAFSFVKV